MYFLGILFAFGALFGWGFDDFTIQKSARKTGTFTTLLAIATVGSIVLLPLIYHDLGKLFANVSGIKLLLAASGVGVIAALLQFKALDRGKIFVMEPIMGLELPLTIAIAVIFLNESFSFIQFMLTATMFTGIILVTTKHHLDLHYHKRMLERGVILSLLAAIFMAVLNVAIGEASKEISPLITIWFTHTVIALIMVEYFLLYRRDKQKLRYSLHHYYKILLLVAFIDNLAWLSYGYAAKYIPISLAITISEAYIILASLLGLWVNKEKFQRHQIIGMGVAGVAVIILAYLHPG